jgi:nicotinamidase-related amidase
MRDYYVVVTSDGTSAYLESDHKGSLFNIERFFGQVVGIADVSEAWERTAGAEAS